jgi:hypothetical protein
MSQGPRGKGCGNYGPPVFSRRDLLRRAGMGFGTLALIDLLRRDGLLAAEGDKPAVRPAVKGKAKSVIFLFMGGGPSQVDTFDPKPELAKLDGKDVPESIARDVPRVVRARLNGLFASPYKFRRMGQSGLPVSEIFPETGKMVDDICVLRSCGHDSPIHAPAEYIAITGTQVGDRPSLGSWLCYGLGSENQNLPGFVVFLAGETGRPVAWSSGFLPSRFQGTVVGKEGVPNLAMPPGVTRENRRTQLDLIGRLNRRHLERHAGDSELEARLRSYELAFRMQTAAGEAFDLSRETAQTQRFYGMGRRPARRSTSRARRRRRSASTAWTTRKPPTWPPTASWPGGWWSAACASCRCASAAGTRTATWRRTTRRRRRSPTGPWRRCWPT